MFVYKRTPFIILFTLFLGISLGGLPAEAGVYPQKSFFHLASTQDQTTEDNLSLTFGLRTDQGHVPQEEVGGKIYFWAESQGQASPDLEALAASLEPGVYMHNTEAAGIIILDGKALFERDRTVDVRIRQPGTYTLKAIYVPQAIAPHTATNFWPYLIGGTTYGQTVTIGPPPASAAHYLNIAPSIDGITLPSQFTYRGGGPLYEGLAIPLKAGSPTRVEVSLSRRDGSPVGSGLPLVAQVNGTGLSLDQPLALTDTKGQASFHLQGTPQAGASIIFIVDQDFSVTMPVVPQSDKPRRIHLPLGQPIMEVDGRKVPLDSPALVLGGRTYVPYRAIAEALGADISYDSHIQTITTTFEDGTLLTMTLGHNQYARNSQVFPMDATPYTNKEGRTMVPIRFIAEATGYTVTPLYDNDGDVASVLITQP